MGDSTFNGGWIFAFLIIAVIFGWGNGGFGGNNAAMAGFATATDVQNSINAAFAAHDAAITVPVLQRAERVANLHGRSPVCRGAG